MRSKTQNPAAFLLRESDRLATGFVRKEISHCGLNTFARAFKSCNSIQAGLLALIVAPATIFTVARPRGILTRFPILPAFMRDTRTL